VLTRLLGLETEYAIRFTPSAGGRRPGNRAVYDAIVEAVGRRLQTLPGAQHGIEQGRVFTESGASLSYESFPEAPDGGLVEGATPECRGPSQAVLYQKALDALLVEAIPDALDTLARRGFRGDLGLLKNCRDAEGHTYGAQENYEAEVARGAGLWLYRAALALCLPLVALEAALTAALIAILLPLVLLFMLAVFGLILAGGPRGRALGDRLLCEEGAVYRGLGRGLRPVEIVVFGPIAALCVQPFRLAFRRQRRLMTAFLASRPILTGAGTLGDDGTFGLSEKAPAVESLLRTTMRPHQRSIFEVGNLSKDLHAPLSLEIRPLLGLFRARQRMQLGLSDSNVAQVAEFLKVGATALVLDMVEAGFVDDAPILADPVASVRALAADPTLRAHASLRSGPPMTAIELSRWYLARAQRFVREAAVVSLDARAVVRAWEQALDALEADPGRLVGELDWVTKRWLIETAGEGAPAAAKKKIDLRYHELGAGYLARLERAGIARAVVTEREIQAALTTPPEATPARLRGQLIRELGRSAVPVRVSWDSIRIGGRLRGKVIPLRRPPPPGDR
jgi:proteasome accessory factor A